MREACFGKSTLFRLVLRNSFAHVIRKVFAHGKLLPGKFWVFVPLVLPAGADPASSPLAGEQAVRGSEESQPGSGPGGEAG